jgi:hypothetical protein
MATVGGETCLPSVAKHKLCVVPWAAARERTSHDLARRVADNGGPWDAIGDIGDT